MFVKVSGLSEAGIDVPEQMRTSANNSCNEKSVILALIRWLTPHPLTLSRDDALRPLCPPPFDINHALWTFAKTNRQRGYFTDHLFTRQLDMFPGSDREVRRLNADTHKNARYDLIPLETMDTFMNCTVDGDDILETITLPFA